MEIINKIKEFINLEADARISKQKELLALPLNQRIKKGEALPHLLEVELKKISTRLNPYHHKILSWPVNNSKFKVGDYVKIHKGNLNDFDNVYEAVIEIEGPNWFIIIKGFGEKSFSEKIGTEWVMERDNPDLRRFFIDAMNNLVFAKHKDVILDIIKRKTKPCYEINDVKEAVKIASHHPFNLKQRKAFIRAYSTNNYALIQGPPGTGKTWLLAHIALALANKGQKVLITSLTHRAINNALMKIRSISDYANIIKAGQGYHADDLEDHHIKCYENFEEHYIKDRKMKGMIVGGSSYSLHTNRLKKVDFDTIIFDEASQITISHTVASMMKGQKFIFIGDHKQMSPIYNAKHTNNFLSKSLFENLIEVENNSIMLDITYRMNDEINRFPNETFYNHKLIPHKTIVKSRCKLNKELLTHMSFILDPEKPNVCIKFDHNTNKMQSSEEAEIIAIMIIILLKAKAVPKDIGVIVPYRAQARIIRSFLNNFPEALKIPAKDIVVDTVERMQGQERDIIFISMASSDKEFINDNAEFLYNPNRFNVAITRAKNKRVFICSNELLNAKSSDYQPNIDFFNKLYETSFQVQMGIKEEENK